MPTIQDAIEQYLSAVSAARSPRTARSYRTGLDHFRAALAEAGLDPHSVEVSSLDEGRIIGFIKSVAHLSPASQALYLTAVRGFYQFLAAERMADPNLPRLQNLVRQRTRRQGRRIPQFPRAEIEALIAYANRLSAVRAEDFSPNAAQDQENPSAPANANQPPEKSTDQPASTLPPPPPPAQPDAAERAAAGPARRKKTLTPAERQRIRLRNLRDRALILFLADTGLRISEACSLTLGDVDFQEARLTVIGKGDQQALVRISQRALDALQDYLSERRAALPSSGQKAKSQPLFTRHDRGAGRREFRPLDSSSAWDIVRARAREAVGEAAEQIHPHSFRHYFVTVVLLATNNLEKTRRLARHKSITVTQRYAEIDPELDKDYYDIFDT